MAFTEFSKFKYLFGNRYITSEGNTKNISITTSGQISIDTHHIEQILNQR